MAMPLNESNKPLFHSVSVSSSSVDHSQEDSKVKRFKSASTVAPENLPSLSSQQSEPLKKSSSSSFFPPFKYQSTLDEDSPLKGKERLYVGKPLEEFYKSSLSESELETGISHARKRANTKQIPELFEKGLPQLLRQLRKVDLLEKFYTSSPYPEVFVQGFIEIELHSHTLFQTFISFIKFQAQRSETPMYFRGNSFCTAAFNTHYSKLFTPELDQIRQIVLKHIKAQLPKSSFGQLTTTHPSFLLILTEVIKEIHQAFDALPEGFVYLLQVRYQSVSNSFPEEALRIAGGPFFLRILNPYLTHPNGLSPSEMKDMVQIVRGVQKVVNGEYFEKCEGDVEATNLALTDLIRTHKVFVNQRLASKSCFS